MVDVIIIGGGPNGLTAAARLAGQGREVLLLERRELLGGLAAGEEFHPGYRHVGVHQETCGFAPEVEQGLGLAGHGLERSKRAPVYLAERDGAGLILGEDPAAELAARAPKDAARFGEWRTTVERYGGVIGPLFRAAPPDTLNPTLSTLLEMGRSALSLRRLGKRDMLDLLRIAPMCVVDGLSEWFEDPLLKAGLALPAISGTWLAPWSVGSYLNLLVQEILAGGEVTGGGAGAVRALEAAARASGATLRTGAQVQRIVVEGGVVRGVELVGGERLEAPRVLATCDPKRTMLELVNARDLGQVDAQRMQAFRARGTTAVVHLALNGPLEFAGRPGQEFGRARVVENLDDLERAFDGVKYGELPARPALEVSVPSVEDSSLAPQGGAVVSMLVSFVPFELKGGWTDARRDELGACALEALAAVAPTVGDRIVGREVLTPLDLAERYGVTGGHVHHGEHALDQLLLRPTPEMARYGTPIEGLFLGSGGNHPGGGLTGRPGWLAAEALARG